MKEEHVYPYEWSLKDANFSKDKGKVFSCFSCGGGSTMGYKLAGFDVIGCNEIDPKMMNAYKTNHKPLFPYLEPIQTFKLRKDLPKELYNLDILDGSPPCSSFSMSGNREKDWGKEKKFREGQANQVLDNLFFDFIDLAKELKPKVVIAENVKGLMMGSAKQYVRRIYEEFDNAGYHCQHWLLDASKMGVPQRRERIFFVCLRKDIAEPFLYQKDFFTQAPFLKLEFKEKNITYQEVEDINAETPTDIRESYSTLWENCKAGYNFSTVHEKGHYFGEIKMSPTKVPNTIIANSHGSFLWHHNILRKLNTLEYCRIGSYPIDYNFAENNAKYLIGMSVPPVMIAQIANQVYKQWLNKL
tara:strand:- start:2233 stop:3303 length:1071 start_codon:yes stop_codon:yes gene_type:complete